MQAVMVIVVEPAGKSFSEVVTGCIAAEAVEFFFIGLVAAFDFAVEAGGARRNEAVLSLKALAHGRKGVDFDGAV